MSELLVALVLLGLAILHAVYVEKIWGSIFRKAQAFHDWFFFKGAWAPAPAHRREDELVQAPGRDEVAERWMEGGGWVETEHPAHVERLPSGSTRRAGWWLMTDDAARSWDTFQDPP